MDDLIFLLDRIQQVEYISVRNTLSLSFRWEGQ